MDAKSLDAVQRALENLPEGLDETYSQIILRLEPNAQSQALGALKWLAFSARPLDLIELSEAAIVDPKKTPAFNESNRFFAFRDVEAILSGLVIVEDVVNLEQSVGLAFRNSRPNLLEVEADGRVPGVEQLNNPGTGRYVVRLAHFSVKEYLMSDRIKVGASSVVEFYITETACHTHIAEACLSYHLYVCQILLTIASEEEGKEAVKKFPLWKYAAKYWTTHMEAVPSERWSSSLTGLARRVLKPRSNVLLMMVHVSEPGPLRRTIYDRGVYHNKLGSPLYYMANKGCLQLSSWLLKSNISGVNDIGGNFKTSLNVASLLGYESLVRLLLCAGANPYQRVENSDFSLSLAIKFRRKNCAMMLLAGPNMLNECHRLGYYPLIEACGNGMATVVKYLLKLGANVNAHDKIHDTALISAARRGDISLVELLIEHGADVNSYGWHSTTALHEAALRPRIPIAKLLIERRSKLNARIREGGTPPHNAASKGAISMMTFLIEHGADVNARNREGGTPLHNAASEGDISMMTLLIEHGADVNAQSGLIYGNALQIAAAAAAAGNSDIVRLLLKHGAKVDPPGRKWENLLREARSEFGFPRKSIDEVQKRFRDLQRMCGEPSRRSGGMTEVEIDNYFKECCEDEPIFN